MRREQDDGGEQNHGGAVLGTHFGGLVNRLSRYSKVGQK